MNQHTVERMQHADAIDVVNRSEIDMQIATARRYPRDPVAAEKRMTDVVLSSPEVAGECYYRLERGDKAIVGPGIRLAEIIAQNYGNIRVATRLPIINAREVMVEYAALDLESNYGTTGSVSMQIVDKNGYRYRDDLINVTCMAATAKARRNGIVAVAPAAMIERLMAKAIKHAAGDEPIEVRRAKAMDHFKAFQVSPERILAAVGRHAVQDLNEEDLQRLRGYATAIRDGHSTIDETFPPVSGGEGDTPGGGGAPKTGTAGVKDKIKRNAVKRDPEHEAPPTPADTLSDDDIDKAFGGGADVDNEDDETGS